MPPVFFSPRTIVLDCGASRTALGVFTRQGSRMRLDEYAVERFAPGSDWLEQIRLRLLALRAQVQAAGPVVVILPAHLVLTKFLKVPRVAPAQRAKIIRFEAGQNIPFALADVAWDSVVAGENGNELEVLLAAAKHEAVESVCAAVEAAGFEPRFVLPSSLATLAGFRLLQPLHPEPSLVLNLGARSTTLLLVEANRFATRTLLFGSHSLTRPPASGQEGDAAEFASLSSRLAQEITRTLLYFRRQSNWPNPTRVYLTGGSAGLAGFAEALTVRLKIPVGWLDVSVAVQTGLGVSPGAVSADALELADLIGAAATQLRPGQPVVDLLPSWRRSRENFRRRQPWLIAAAVLAVAALLPPVVHFRRVTGEAQRKTAAIERVLAPLREREARNRANLRQLEKLGDELVLLQSAYDRRSSWLNLLADLQDRLVRVEDVWLEKLQVVPPAAGASVKLAISGRMLDRANPLAKVSPETLHRVKTLLGSLGDSPFVAAVESEHFDNNQAGILRFDCVLVPNPQHPL